MTDVSAAPGSSRPVAFAKLLDQSRCIGCHACTTACKSENEVPLGVTRTYVKSVDTGLFPAARRDFQVTRCNQCTDAPCVAACPTSAMYQRRDGIVDFDKESCIGCKACMAACPYDAIFINPEDHSAEKCNFCAHRLDVGLEPACVVVCPVEAILVGDLNDPSSRVAQAVGRTATEVRRPEKGTRPKVFYRGASQRTLDPLAAERPRGGIFAWAQQAPEGHGHINAGVPAGHTTSQAAAIVSYDVPHHVPWDWRVGLYTWTKGIAAGVYLVAAALVLAGVVETDDALWRWVVPLVALGALSATGAVLVWDLEHPERFYFIFTRPQWRSWLVRGGFVLAAYGAVLSAHLVASLVEAGDLSAWLMIIGIPIAIMTAVYTAFLFAQAKARDLWQNPLLPAHLAVQSALVGAATLVLAGADGIRDEAAWIMVAAAAVHLLMVAGELTLSHVSAHARLALHHLARGTQREWFWLSVVLIVAAAALGPWLAPFAAPMVLAGVLAYEHAYVQAAQMVPLA